MLDTRFAFSRPIPVTTKSTFALPTRARNASKADSLICSTSRNFRQGANSASTANVTRMRISESEHSGRFGPQNLLGPTWGDVAVRLIPAHRALQRRRNRPRLKSQFAHRARSIHKHHVLRNFHALHRDLRFAPDQPRK